MPYNNNKKAKNWTESKIISRIPFDRQMLVAKALGVPANRIVVRTKRMGEFLL